MVIRPNVGQRVLDKCGERVGPSRAAGLGKLLRVFIGGQRPIEVGLSSADFLRAIGRGIADVFLEDCGREGVTIAAAAEPAEAPRWVRLRLRQASRVLPPVSHDMRLGVGHLQGAFLSRNAVAGWLAHQYLDAAAHFGHVFETEDLVREALASVRKRADGAGSAGSKAGKEAIPSEV